LNPAMSVRLLTSLRNKPRARLQNSARFCSSLGGSVVADMIISFLTSGTAPRQFWVHGPQVPSRKDIPNRRTPKHPSEYRAFRYSPILDGSWNARKTPKIGGLSRTPRTEHSVRWRGMTSNQAVILVARFEKKVNKVLCQRTSFASAVKRTITWQFQGPKRD
jgi:hypothetical protein